MESYALLLAATLNAGTVLAIAALGLLINEKSGIVNLGAEGMMLCAAIAGFATVVHTGNDWLGFAAGMGAGALLAAIFGVLVIWLNTNQYATGIALSLFGSGFSAFIGIRYVPPDSNRLPYVQNYSFGFQYQLPASTVLELNYIGNKGTRLDAPGLDDLNQVRSSALVLGDALLDPLSAHTGLVPSPYTGFNGTVAQALRPFPQYQGINQGQWPDFGTSALQLATD